MQDSVFGIHKNREVRIFISSTFRDMMNEREILIKKTFPSLRNMFKDRGVTITEVDLRWGVLEEEVENGKVIEICLNEIDKSRPYFIGILGERYGWVPGISEYQNHKKIIEDFPWVKEDVQSGMSITEMEIQYGVLRNPDMVKRSAFFFRESEKSEPEELNNNALRQRKLKETIINTEGLYTACYSNVDSLADMIIQHLARLIDSDFPQSDDNSNLQSQLNYINTLKLTYVKNEDYYFVLDRHFENSHTPIVITGETGIGKSSFLANYLLNYAAKNPDELYLFNFSGASLDSSDYIKVLQRFCEELSGREIDLGTEFPSDTAKQLLKYFTKLLNQTSPRKTTLVIDGLDEFNDDDYSRLIHWLPDAFPENVKVILSCGESPQLKRVREKDYRVFTLTKFNTNNKVKFINTFFNFYSKKLPGDIVDEIVSDELSDLPVTLKSLADELRQYGVHEALKERVRYYLTAEEPVQYYDLVLNRLEEDFNIGQDDLVKNCLSVIALMKGGIKELEIQQILNISPLDLATVFNSIENNLLNQNGFYSFGNPYFNSAVENRYLSDKLFRKEITERIIDYLTGVVWTVREVNVIAGLLLEMNDKARLYELISNFNSLLYLQDADRFALIKYWNLLKNEYSVSGTYTDKNIEEFVENNNYGFSGVLTAYNIVATLLYDLGNYKESDLYFEKIFELSLKEFGEDNQYTQSNLLRLINIKLKLNELEAANKYAVLFLEICGKYYEESDLAYLHSVYKFGSVLLAQKNFEEAIQTFGYVINSINREDDYTADNDIPLFQLDLLEDVLKCYIYMGLKEEAVKEGTVLLELKTSIHGGDSSEVAETLKTLAEINAEVGNFEEASAYYKRSYEINSKLFGKFHPISNEILAGIKNLHKLKNAAKNIKI